MAAAIDDAVRSDLFDYLLRLGDDNLVLGQRLGEWCGHGPTLEEDIGLANISLDCLGQATGLLRLAGEVEGRGRDEDRLAFHRDVREFNNAMLVEQPNGDYAKTIVRQFLYDAFGYHQFEALTGAPNEDLAGIAAKAVKEVRYHVRHAGEWLVRFGDGTEESHRRAQEALDELWCYTDELFERDEVVARLVDQGLAADPAVIRPKWNAMVKQVAERATLSLPEDTYQSTGSRQGIHTEHLGHLLAEMQILPRTYPDAKW